MTAVQTWSALLGIGIAAANGAGSLFVLKRSMQLTGTRFFRRVLGSLAIRMLAIFVAVVLVIALLPVDAAVFGIAFVIGVVVTLVLEMWILLRWARSRG